MPLLNKKLTINKNTGEQSEMVYYNQNEPLSANYLIGPKRSKFETGLTEPVLNELKHNKHTNISI